MLYIYIPKYPVLVLSCGNIVVEMNVHGYKRHITLAVTILYITLKEDIHHQDFD